MPLPAPDLDDRTFEELFREARLRIPRYTPEWTDFNETDPGITLLQLGAWLTETTLYRLNQVPDRNYVKFLDLVGLALRPALPARVKLVFTPTGRAVPPPVPAGSQVAGQPAGGGEPVVFETVRELQPVAWPLADLLVFDGVGFRDLKPANEDPRTSFRPLGWVPQVGSALYLGFQPPDPLPASGRVFPREIRLACFLPTAATAGEPVAVGAPPPRPPVDLVWEYKREAASRTWRRLNLLADGSAAFTQDGEILIAGPEESAADLKPFVVHASEPRWWIRCRLRGGSYPAGFAPEIDALHVNAVEAVNLVTRRDELLEAADGLPDLVRELRYKPVEPESLEVAVIAAGMEEAWRRVDDLLASKPDDPHFTLDPIRGALSFGDGTHGRIPPAGADLVARRYRHGGGAAGNLPAGAVNAPLTALSAIREVSNPRPAAGGKDQQSIDDLKRRAPARLRHRDRAISAADFAALAAEAPGVERAHAIGRAHPDHPGVEVPGAVTVLVVPDRGDSPRVPSAELLRSVAASLDELRLLTTEVYVQGPKYVPVQVRARLTVRPYAALDRAVREVGRALDRFLDPLVRGFGESLFPSRLVDVILDAGEDVVAVPWLELVVDGKPLSKQEPRLVVPAGGLVFGRDHQLVAEREEG